ncbi:MAG: ribbon-helix-helix domain-containing protein [Chloroflexota bacterium]
MAQQTVRRRRVKIGATVDPDLLHEVDKYVQQHAGTDRSKVIDDALRLWYAKQQAAAMEAQYSSPDDVDPEEWAAWKAISRASTERLLESWGEK